MLRVVVASREFPNVDDLMTDVANGCSARLLSVWAPAMPINRRSRKELTRLLFTYGIRKKPCWYTVFSKQFICCRRVLEKDRSPSITFPGCTNACFVEPKDMLTVGYDRACAGRYALTYSQCTATRNLALAKHAGLPNGALVRQLD